MPSLAQNRSLRFVVSLARASGMSGAIVFASMIAIGFVPLFEGPGYESSLASGLVVPLITAIAVAWRTSRTSFGFERSVREGLLHAARLASITYLTLLIHGLRAGFCSFGGGSALFVLGPACGILLAGVWGAYSAKIARTSRLAITLAILGIVASIAAGFARFLTSPMVFGFDPFVGFFSGTLYDTVIDGTDRLLTYRAGTLSTIVAAIGLAIHLDRSPRFTFRGWPTLAFLLGVSGSLAITILGPHFGHWQTPITIRRELGGAISSRLCDVIYPHTMRPEDARLFARDCDADIDQVSAYLGTKPERVTAYLFADAAQKRRLMGAADVYIAKPWRHEVYVQVSGYPHPVLGHELAHVLAGSFGRGPFHIAGDLGGLIPNPGLIEGIAVAASPDDDELSPEAWSRAMLDLGILPPLESIFSLGFLQHDAARAYTVAGAFVSFAHDRFGAEIVRKWYGGESLPSLTGRSWNDLEADFRTKVKSLPIPDSALALAKARFERAGIFSRRCPHEVDAKKQNAMFSLGAGDALAAKRIYDELLSEERRDAGTRLARVTCEERLGELDGAQIELASIASDETFARPLRDRAEERMGDLALTKNDIESARAHYQIAASHTLDEDHLRTLDVKFFATQNDAARVAITWLLIGKPERGPDASRAAEELGRWSERDAQAALPRYLLARSASQRSDWQRAAELFDRALELPSDLPRVYREAARQRVIVGCVSHDPEGVARGIAAWSSADPPIGNRDTLLRALAARCLRD